MRELNYNEFAAIGIQIVITFMLMRSCFYLLRVRQETKKKEFYLLLGILITGIVLTSYNVTDPKYVMQRFPFNQVFLFGCAWAFLLLTRSKKEDLFSITNVIKREYSAFEHKVVLKINAEDIDGPERVTRKDLAGLELGKPYLTSNRTLLIHLRPPKNKGILFKFSANMLKGGKFAPQYHLDMDKEIYVDLGSITTAEHPENIYHAGDVLIIPAGDIHTLVSLERTKISAYFYEKAPIEDVTPIYKDDHVWTK